jgi:hypothetical protein
MWNVHDLCDEILDDNLSLDMILKESRLLIDEAAFQLDHSIKVTMHEIVDDIE